jgi:hypothetical protein
LGGADCVGFGDWLLAVLGRGEPLSLVKLQDTHR